MPKKTKDAKDGKVPAGRRPDRADRPGARKTGGDHGLTQKEKEEARSH